jgi:hypothetical protein
VSPTVKRLGLLLLCTAAGVVVHSPFLVWSGLLGLSLVVALASWSRRSGDKPAPAWSAALIFGVLAAGMSGSAIFFALRGGAAYFIAFVALLPAIYFGYMSWVVVYYARHGERHPSADRAGRIAGFLNRDIRRS